MNQFKMGIGFFGIGLGFSAIGWTLLAFSHPWISLIFQGMGIAELGASVAFVNYDRSYLQRLGIILSAGLLGYLLIIYGVLQ